MSTATIPAPSPVRADYIGLKLPAPPADLAALLLGLARSSYPLSGYRVLDSDDNPVFFSIDFERAVSHAEDLFDGELNAGAEYEIIRREWDEGWTRVVCGSVVEVGEVG